MNWLLDTDVVCQPARKNGDAKIIAWLEAEQDRGYTSAVVIAQVAYWVRTKEVDSDRRCRLGSRGC